MDYEGFISTIRHEADIADAEAERAACATLQTLAERLTTGEAEDIAERLPQELRRCLEPGAPEPFHLDEFLRRVSDRVGVDRPAAERDARAVFAALWGAVGPDEFADMRAELPKDFDPLLDEALRTAPPPPELPAAPLLSFDQFLERVAARLGGDRDRAQRAAEAVLEALASRITGGQVEDLEAYLPIELRPALERGRARTGGRARPIGPDEFLGDIARLENLDRGAGAEHARAVFATLREAVPEKEFKDMQDQLPDEFRPLLKEPGR
jgi:uncharacterized protein (DUF2267 family)